MEGGSIGKIILLSFEDDEDEMINSVLSALEVGRRTYRIGETKLVSELYFDNLSISPDKREVTRNNGKIKLTFTEFEILFLLAQNPIAVCGALQHVRVNKNLVKGLGRLFLTLLFYKISRINLLGFIS